MLRRALFLLLFLLPAPGKAQSFEQSFEDLSLEGQALEDQSLEGSWALRLDGAIIFRFDLIEGGDGWSGTWSRPGSFASDGDRFANLKGPTETLKAAKGRAIGGWAELTFADNRPGAVADVFRFRLLEPGRAEMIYAGTGLAPYTLERVAEGSPLGPWESGRAYAREGAAPAVSRPRPDSPEPREPEPREEVQGPPGEPAFEGR